MVFRLLLLIVEFWERFYVAVKLLDKSHRSVAHGDLKAISVNLMRHLQVLARALDLELKGIIFNFALDHGLDFFVNEYLGCLLGGLAVELDHQANRLQLVLVTYIHQSEQDSQTFTNKDLAKGSDVTKGAVARKPIKGYVVPVAAELYHLLRALLNALRPRCVVVFHTKSFLTW